MQRIFEKVLSKDKFEGIWQCLNKNQENKKPDQEEMASVAQFRAEILKKLSVMSAWTSRSLSLDITPAHNKKM